MATTDLPTPQEDQRVQKLKSSLDTLSDEIEELEEAVPKAEEDAQAARDEADELAVEVYASSDVSESDVEAAEEKAEKAEEKARDLRKKLDNKKEAVERVKREFRIEINERAGKRFYEDYAEAYIQTSERLEEAAEEFLDALEEANEVRKKALDYSVVTTGETPPLSYPTWRQDLGSIEKARRPVEKAVRAVVETQSDRLPAVREHLGE